jgi:hypothetical protein
VNIVEGDFRQRDAVVGSDALRLAKELRRVTGLKVPRMVSTFFLYSISAGVTTEPSGLNMMARVFQLRIRCRLIARLSTSSK